MIMVPGDEDSLSWTEPLPVWRVQEDAGNQLGRDAWPATLAPVRQVLEEGLDLGRATILVGENGSGKSTLIEGIAMAYGLSAEGGNSGARHSTYASESGLSESLQLVRGLGTTRWGYFLRAETMHGLFTYLTSSSPSDGRFHRLSHGESFLAMLGDDSRFSDGGFIVMDEPEAGLSFTAQLTLLGRLSWLAEQPRGQVLIATHSPVVAALPGARLLELDESGIHQTDWESLAAVDHYRRFMGAPQSYLRHLFG